MTFTVFLRNIALVSVQRTRNVQDEELFIVPGLQVPSLHAISAGVGKSACRAVEHEVKSFDNLETVWETARDDDMETLVASQLTLCTLHATLLNFSESDRRLQIMYGLTVLAYLSISFLPKLSDVKHSKSRFKGNLRVAALRWLHECIWMCLRPLSGLACKSYQFYTKSSITLLAFSIVL